jgi:hypothetical protein
MFFSILTLLVVKNLAKNMGEELGVQLDSASTYYHRQMVVPYHYLQTICRVIKIVKQIAIQLIQYIYGKLIT